MIDGSNRKYIAESLVARGYSDDKVLKTHGGTWLKFLKMIGG